MTQSTRKANWLENILSKSGAGSSLQVKMTLWSGAILAVASIILIVYSANTLRQTAVQDAQNQALAIAESNAQLVSADLNVPLLTARTIANSLEAIKDPQHPVSMTRDQVDAMLKRVASENPSFLATYTLWEPNAFDGLDAKYKGTEGTDATGRFIPYWVNRPDGSVTVEALIDYETPVSGDWYLQPRATKKEYTIAPLIYPVAGKDTVMATFTVPIVVNDKFYGIAGVDAPIAFVQDIVDSVNLYGGKAEAVLLTDAGTLIAVHNSPDLTNKPATEIYPDFENLQSHLVAGEVFVSPSPDGKKLRIFSPINIGEVGAHWSFSLIIPFSEITAAATTSVIRQVAISIGLIIVAFFLLWFLNGQVVRPIRELTNVAVAISQGNLNMTADIQSTDEIGVLANVFNTMTSQLHESFTTMEHRIAERTRNLELAAEVGRSVSQVSALDVMLKDAAELIRSRFDLYYAQVYLTNAAQNALTLQAGTGKVGVELLGRSHSLPLNTASINGRAAIEKRSVVISDTAASATFRPNPLLPNTRSEMAVPLMIGEKVVGVLDMQSEHAGALSEEVLSAFEALAGQLAIAIQNANLLAEAEKAREEVEVQARRLVRRNWEEHLDAIHEPEQTGFIFEGNQIVSLDDTKEFQQPEAGHALTSPISISGESVGTLVVELDAQNQTPQNTELVNTVARQVAQQIENLRLLENAERYRSEAEQTARRATIEGWKQYMETRTFENLGFMYDLNAVRPHSEVHPTDGTATTLPIKAGDETIGKMSVMGLESNDSASIELANAVVQRLGAHIENLRLFEETKRGQLELDKRARQLASVAEISTISSQELDIQKMLETVVHLTQRRFGLYHAHVFTYSEHTDTLDIMACGYKEGDEHEGTHGTAKIPLAQEQSLVARAGRTRKAVIVNDVRNEPGWLPNPLLPDTAAEMAVPLIVGDQMLGVLDVQADHINAFTEEDASIQTTLASQVATSLQNARSFAQSQQQADRESTLNLISQKIQSATTVEAVLQIAARELGHALGAPMTIAQLSMRDKN